MRCKPPTKSFIEQTLYFKIYHRRVGLIDLYVIQNKLRIEEFKLIFFKLKPIKKLNMVQACCLP